jgi:hypothetical protein
LLAVGIIVLIISLGADPIGIGSHVGFGYLQIAGTVAGVIGIVVGLVLTLRA